MTNPSINRWLCVVTLLVWRGASVEAQVISAPPRSVPVADALTGAHHDVIVSGTLLGGYDQDTSEQLAGPIEGLSINNYNTFGDGRVRYSFVKGVHSIDMTGRGYINAYPGSDVDPGFGGDGHIDAGTAFGRTLVTGGGGARHEPFFTLGTFAPLDTEVGAANLPDASSTNGFRNERSLTLDGFASVSRLWAPRHTTDARYSYFKRDRQGTLGQDYSWQNVQLGYSFAIGRAGGIGVSYVHSRTEFQEIETSFGAGYTSNQSTEFQAYHTIRVSRTRQISISGAVGAEHVAGELDAGGRPYQYWAPSARGGLQMDIGRHWAFAGDYRRSVATLDAVTGQSFPSDTVFVRAGGPVAGRLTMELSGGFANGRAGPIGETAAYRNYTVTGQMSYDFSLCCSAVLNYNRYDYRLRGVTPGPGEPPSAATRGSVRAGFVISFPLVDTRSPAENPGRRGRS